MLSPRGTPTPVVATLLAPPESLMTPIPAAELQARVAASPLHAEYAKIVDRESAREMLEAKARGTEGIAKKDESGDAGPGRGKRVAKAAPADGPDVAQQIGKALGSPLARTVGRELVRGLFGVLGISTTPRRPRRRLW